MAGISRAPSNNDDADFFSAVLDLEDQYYAEGYASGVADGSRAGRIEGRTFGLEKGFEKFLDLGRLGGRGAVWSARLALAPESGGPPVASLTGSERLRRQVERLGELTDAGSLSTVNDEESVDEVDERLREARAKGMLVAKMAGERALDAAPASSNVEGELRVKDAVGVKAKGAAGKEMEDFMGLPAAKRKEG